MKRLLTKEDEIVNILAPVSLEEIRNRNEDYDVLTPKQFGTKYKSSLFNPVEFIWNEKKYQIQYNHCANPFCKWHGLPQEKFQTKGKPCRYRLSGSGTDKSIVCNPDLINPSIRATLGCTTITLSNWSLA